MSKRFELKERVRTLAEIKDILTAMKNLSLVEISKLTRYLATQRQAVASIEDAIRDFVSFHPLSAGSPADRRAVYLLVGSERGFCGGFNETVVREFDQVLKSQNRPAGTTLIVIGDRLAAKLPGDPRVGLALAGPSAPEEISAVIDEVLKWLGDLERGPEALGTTFLTVIHNEETESGVAPTVLQPFDRFTRAEPRCFPFPPVLNLDPARFLVHLADHYLFSILHYAFYSSLMAEHRQRVRHMEGAVKRLEGDVEHLSHRLNALRQEEITEEIEVIMLSVEALQNELGFAG
jgi:F-type H+-transporting ATPase subunit gamma